MNKYLKEQDRLWCEEVDDDDIKSPWVEWTLFGLGSFCFGVIIGACIF
jgi:hypothetical protein